MKDFKNWEDYKGALLENLSTREAKILGKVFEDTHAENVKIKDDVNSIIVESTAPGSTVTSNISRYDQMFMPLIRRTMPALLAMDLVGVQPMGAQGIVRTLRARYSEETLASQGGAVKVEAGTEASGQVVFDKYSKLVLGGNYDDVDNLDPFEQTVYLEGNRGKPMDIEVLTKRIEPMSRKLAASWSLEANDDLNNLDGLDLETEVTTTLGDQIIRDLDREIIDELTALAGTVESFDFTNVDGRYAGEKLAALTIAIDNLSAQIAMKTRKSGATWMVVSQRVFTALKNASNTSFIPVNRMQAANNGDLQIGTSLFVGTFGSGVNVYVDPYAETDRVLMGRKGSDLDAPFIYAPYIPIQSSGAVRNPETGDFRVMLRTRYGFCKFTDTNDSLGDSPDHIARAVVSNLQLGFTNA